MNRFLKMTMFAAGAAVYLGAFAGCKKAEAPFRAPEAEAPELPPPPSTKGFARIPAGTFQMGSAAGYEDNAPAHRVTLVRPFYMSDHEVTQKEYAEIMRVQPSSYKIPGEAEPGDLPVETISWYDAIDYCNKLSERDNLTPVYHINGKNITWDKSADGYRLPTEAEWEYAARAGDNTTDALVWSGTAQESAIDEYAWFGGNASYSGSTTVGAVKTHAIRAKKPNAWGLYDMTGNVWEWCWDAWDGKTAYSSEAASDPDNTAKLERATGKLPSGIDRAVRGGRWFSTATDCAVTNRYHKAPGSTDANIGFRVCRTIQTLD